MHPNIRSMSVPKTKKKNGIKAQTLIGILAFEQLEKDWESLKRIDDRKQSQKCADEQRQDLSLDARAAAGLLAAKLCAVVPHCYFSGNRNESSARNCQFGAPVG
jgi:hypothetical protein